MKMYSFIAPIRFLINFFRHVVMDPNNPLYYEVGVNLGAGGKQGYYFSMRICMPDIVLLLRRPW